MSLRVVPLAPGVSDEASGIAAAATRPGAYFLVDDGTGTDDLAVVDEQGALLTRVVLDGMSASNAEALSAGPCGPMPLPDSAPPGNQAAGCLYVGDIGDNAQRRADVVVYRAAEPDVSAPDPGSRITVPADEWRYTYPDGPHNAESMMIAPDGSPIIVTKPKDNAPHRMYRGKPAGGRWSRSASSGRPALSGRCGPSSPATWRPTWRSPRPGAAADLRRRARVHRPRAVGRPDHVPRLAGPVAAVPAAAPGRGDHRHRGRLRVRGRVGGGARRHRRIAGRRDLRMTSAGGHYRNRMISEGAAQPPLTSTATTTSPSQVRYGG